MQRNILFILGVVIAIGFFAGCNNKKKPKKTYYPSGKLKSSGWYIKDSIPVDTLFNFFENGNVSSVQKRNDSGYLNGLTRYYYDNGILQAIDNYENDYLQGFGYRYSKSGKLYSKILYSNDKQVGDCYWYDIDGISVNKYAFYDFLGHNRNLIEWDSTGNIVKDLRPIAFVDSIRAYNDVQDKDNERSYDISLLISNPPKCLSIIKIEYISKSGILIKKDSVGGEHHYVVKERFPDSLFTIRFVGIQYDSIKKKSSYYTSSSEIGYEK